jgi:hypothetical protein
MEEKTPGTGASADAMEKIIVRRLHIGSYIMLFLLTGLCLGAVAGLILFIAALFGVPVHAYIGSLNFWGIGAGAFALIFGPFICASIAMVLAALMYLPFTFIIRLLKGLKLTAEIEHTSNIKQYII